MVECQLPKLNVAGSNPVTRFSFRAKIFKDQLRSLSFASYLACDMRDREALVRAVALGKRGGRAVDRQGRGARKPATGAGQRPAPSDPAVASAPDATGLDTDMDVANGFGAGTRNSDTATVMTFNQFDGIGGAGLLGALHFVNASPLGAAQLLSTFFLNTAGDISAVRYI